MSRTYLPRAISDAAGELRVAWPTITSDRLLLTRAGGSMTLKAKELLTEVPIADVDSLEVGKGTLGKPVASAFQQARAGAATGR